MGFGFEVVVSAFVRNKILCLARSEGRYARNAKQISAAREVFVRVWGYVFWEKYVETLSRVKRAMLPDHCKHIRERTVPR